MPPNEFLGRAVPNSRMPGTWFPADFARANSPRRLGKSSWLATLMPLYAVLPLGLERHNDGSLELSSSLALFSPVLMRLPPEAASALGVPAGEQTGLLSQAILRPLGAGGSFILPAVPTGERREGIRELHGEHRADLPGARAGRRACGGRPQAMAQSPGLTSPATRLAFPRAWVVHQALVRPPAEDAAVRASLIRRLSST